MALLSDSIPHFGRKLFEEIDQYISAQYRELTCDDIHRIYFQFFKDMKDFKGNSNGFTGLSEYLLFRSVFHLLGGSFEPRQITRDLYEFVSTADEKICISQSTRVNELVTKGRRLYPDIAISYANNLLAVCQIKIYLTQGAHEIESELEKLDYLKSCYADLKALLVVFMAVSNKGKISAYLDTETSKRRQWFRYQFLQGDKRVLANVLEEGLDLNHLMNCSIAT